MFARSIDPSTVEPSGAISVAPTTSLLVPFVKPTQMSTEPELLAPFESQPVGVALPRMHGCASAVKPSGKTIGLATRARGSTGIRRSALGHARRWSRLGGHHRGRQWRRGGIGLADSAAAAEEAGQNCAAEQRKDPEREEAEDGDRTEAGPALTGLLPLFVRIAVVLLVVGGVVEVVDVLRLAGHR